MAAGAVCALIPAAGRGVRFGGSDNKVFVPLLGRPLLAWTLDAFALCDAIEAKRGVGAIGMLSGGFLRHDLEVSGCVAVYRGPADLLAHYDETVRLRA